MVGQRYPPSLTGEDIFIMFTRPKQFLEAQVNITGKAKSRRAVWLLPNFVKSKPPGCDCKRHKIVHNSFLFFSENA